MVLSFYLAFGSWVPNEDERYWKPLISSFWIYWTGVLLDVRHGIWMGYAVSRIEWKGWVGYTAWGRSAGAAVLTGAAQAYNEAQAVSQLSQRIAEQRGAV